LDAAENRDEIPDGGRFLVFAPGRGERQAGRRLQQGTKDGPRPRRAGKRGRDEADADSGLHQTEERGHRRGLLDDVWRHAVAMKDGNDRVIEMRPDGTRRDQKRLSRDVAYGNARLLGEGMIRRQREHQRLVRERGCRETGRHEWRVQDADIDIAGRQRSLLVGRIQFAQGDLHLRITRPICPHGARHDAVERNDAEAETQAPAASARHEPDGIAAGVDVPDGRARMIEERDAGIRQPDMSSVSIKQRCAEARLERADSHAQRRLRQVHARRCAPEVQLFGDGDETLQSAQIHLGA